MEHAPEYPKSPGAPTLVEARSSKQDPAGGKPIWSRPTCSIIPSKAYQPIDSMSFWYGFVRITLEVAYSG